MFLSYFKSPYFRGKNLWLSIFLYIIGMFSIGFGAVLTIHSNAGAGGYDALIFVLSEKIGVPPSFVIYFIAFLSVVASAVIRRSFPKLTTFITGFLLGIIVDLCKYLLQNVYGNTPLLSILFLLGGMVLIGFGVGAYLLSKFPANPIDDFVLALNEKGISLRVAKLSFDIPCFLLAFLLGGAIGWGSFVITIGLGPLIQFWTQFINKQLSLFSIDRLKNPMDVL